MKILLIEDNRAISKGLVYTLEQNGFEVALCENAESTLNSLGGDFDLFIVDVSLPDGNGFELCNEIKRVCETPVIFLTALDDEDSIVKGFDLGAEDYITKPFSSRELLARIKRITKKLDKTMAMNFGDISIDFDKKQVCKNGNPVVLTALEYRLFAMLAITGLFCCAVAVGIGAGFNAVRESTDKKIIAVAEKVREQYPDISEKELAQILNSDTAGIKGDFAKYGIKFDSGWVDIQSGSYATITIVIATAGVCVFGILLCVVFIRYCKKQKRQRLEIVKCLEKINNREYDLDLDGSTDDDMSLLKQEIQKTTVMLREYADNSMREKEILKNSLADISHQLKTPLTSILITTENILDDDDMPVGIRRDFVMDIAHNAHSINFLVKSLLTLSMLDSGTVELKFGDVSVKKIIDECISRTEVLADIRDVRIEKTVKNDFMLNCDFRWICEAVSNIVKNCIEHTDGGYVRISAERNSMYSEITVSDNGCGISPKDLPHIFERFYKARNSSPSSVGIGLSLAKSIVEKTGGYITADSKLGVGSTFKLRFLNVRLR